MSEPKLIDVMPLSDHRIVLTYKTAEQSEQRIFDVKPYIKGNWYGRLKESTYFNSVHISGDTVEWAGGQDLAPHELYDVSIPVNDLHDLE